MNAEPDSEWNATGWRIVLGCALASGAGVVLLFFSFSLFVLPIMGEFGITRGELGAVQALVVTGALGAPAIGWLADRYGAARAYAVSALAVAAGEITMALVAHSLAGLALSIGFVGFFGVGTTGVTTTRPVSEHFVRHRGKALGMVAAGVSVTTILAPPPLQAAMEAWGWQGAVIALALLTLAVGIPAMLFLVPRGAGDARTAARAGATPGDRSFLRTHRFWLLALSGVAVGAATSSFISQLSPMIQEEGVSAGTAAVALSLFAAGQLVGRIGGGVLLDRFDPRRIAVAMLLIPGAGFAVLLAADHMTAAALGAAFLIGALAGAELDIHGFFVARGFALSRYSSIYGALVGIGWLGNATGVIAVGALHDRFGSYAPAQLAALLAVIGGAALLAAVRLPGRDTA